MQYLETIKQRLFNNKNIVTNVILTFFIRGGAVVVALLAMPAYLNYFSDAKILGVWFTLLSVMSWILNFDLGIGHGLRNNLVIALGENDRVKVKKCISSSYITIGVFVAISFLISAFILPLIDWNNLFNIDNDIVNKEILLRSIQIIFSGIMVQFLLKLVTSISFAFQKSFIPNLLSLISNIIQLLYMIIINHSGLAKDNIIELSYVHILAVNLPLLITSIIFFTTKLKDCKPNIRFFNKKIAKDVLMLGGAFFWVQIMYMLLYSTNEFFITCFYNTENVVDYQIYYKLFSLIGTFFSLALIPIWSAVTKAVVENNKEWIKKLFVFLKKASLVGVICEFLFIVILQFVVNIWLKENTIQIDYWIALNFAIYGSIFVFNSVLSSIANGLGKLKVQLLFFTVGVLLKIPILLLLNNIYNNWINVIISTNIVMIPFIIIQNYALNNELKGEKGNARNNI